MFGEKIKIVKEREGLEKQFSQVLVLRTCASKCVFKENQEKQAKF